MAKLIENGMKKAIRTKVVAYDIVRQMKGAKKVKSSEFADEIIKNM